ncbi:MAG: hypothetical protein ACREBE_15860 [bacterium]
MLEEYKSVRDELIRRLELQQQLLNFALISASFTVPLVANLAGSQQRIVLLLGALLAAILGLVLLAHDRMIRLLAAFVNEWIAPHLTSLLPAEPKKPLFGWELYQLSYGMRNPFAGGVWAASAVIRHLLFLALGGLALGTFGALAGWNWAGLSDLERWLVIVDVGSLVAVALMNVIGAWLGWSAIRARKRRPSTDLSARPVE